MENSYPNTQDSNLPKQPNFYHYPPVKPKKSRWWIPLAVIGGIILFVFILLAGLGMFFGSMFSSEPMEVKSNSVLYLNLNYDVSEYTTMSPLDIFTSKKQPSFFEIISSIEKAKTDDRIKGIYIKAENSQIGFAKSIELNQTIEDFKKSGKFVYGYLETGDEKDYMLTLPAQKIFMPLEGIVTIDGFGINSLFLKGFLDKIGVDFYVCGFEDFKSAAETYSRSSFSDSSKYQLRVYLNQLYGHFLDAVHHYRKIDRNKANGIINEGVYTTDGMRSNGFIDEIAIESKVKDEMAKLAFGKEYSKDKKLRLVNISDYIYSEPYKKDDKFDYENQIAIVYGSGGITHGDKTELFSSEKSVYANQFVKNLKKAVDNPKIKAIIIRIDSPGGSVLGSEIIWQEIQNAKKVKPVYASMSDVAASGGYYIAMACDTIIAHPATITGSIGVISAIPNFSGTIKQLGMSVDTLSTNTNSNFFSVMSPVTDKMKTKFYDMSKVIYHRFISKVAESRKMSFEDARSLAKGRVWTGADAKEKGLVDVLGDLRTAIKMAKKRIGVPENKKIMFQIYPRPNDDFASILQLFGQQAEDEDLSQEESLMKTLSIKLGKEPTFLSLIYNSLPNEMRKQFNYNMELLQMTYSEKVLMAMPTYIEAR